MNNTTCLIYNFAQHYRTNIFVLLDQKLPIDFVFGDKYLDVKKMDYSLLQNPISEVKNINFFNSSIYYQTGILKLLNKKYRTYLMLGEPICISTWLMLIFSKLFNKKIYLWSHGWYGKESKVTCILKKIFFSMSDGIFLYGNYAKKLMIKEGFKNEKLHVIYNSLNYDEQILLRKSIKPLNIYKNKFQNNYPNIIFIGRITKVKKLHLLFHAINELKNNNIYINLTLIGEGEEKENLKSLGKKLNLNKYIWFYGSSYNENELSKFIYNADLCVSPGNVGLTAMHSMVYGTPVITHNKYPFQMPEFEAVINEKTGMFFEYENYFSLAKTIKYWFSLKKDRELIRRNCYEIIDKQYNPHVQIEIFKKYLI